MTACAPAYPYTELDGDGSHYHDHPGLTKRELFAAMAMQGLCASFAGHRMTVQAIAPLAVKAADALLAELAKDGAA